MQAAKEKYLAGGRAGSAETFKQPTVSPLSSASSFEHKRNWLSRQVQVIMYTFTLVHVTDFRFCLHHDLILPFQCSVSPQMTNDLVSICRILQQGYGSGLQDHGASPEAVAYNDEQFLPKVLNKSQVHSPVTSPRILLPQSHDEAPASTDAVLRYALWHNHAQSHANSATVQASTSCLHCIPRLLI